VDTHCALLPFLSNPLSVIDELAKRSVRFIQNCLDSDSLVVRTMSSYGVCVGRMLSQYERNAFFSCSRFNTKIGDLSKLTVTQMRRHSQSALNDELVNTTSVLLELLYIRDGAYSFYFDTDEVNMFISCISRQYISCTMCILYIGCYSCVFLYSFIFSILLCLVHDFHNKYKMQSTYVSTYKYIGL